MDISSLYNSYIKTGVVSTDSRNITAGCIFFALKGDSFNGNLFASEALDKGASYAVVDEEPAGPDQRIIKVDSVLDALQRLATYHRLQSGVTVLAITGSNGKTTTKELCREVLSMKFRVHATEGNLNNHIGVPLTLLSMKSDCEIAIVEMGANHHGEISMLCEIACPDYGLVTNVGRAHLEGFGDIEGVARAKGELYSYLVKNGRTLFLNAGNSYLVQQVPPGYENVRKYNGSDGLKAAGVTGDPFLSLTAGDGKTKITFNTNLAGRYNVENVLAACAVGLHFKISPDRIREAIENYSPRNNRSQIIKTTRNTVFMDAYNANPSSMTAAINEFINNGAPDKMLILGEMREVGDTSQKEHDEIISLLQKHNIRNVICVGKAFEKPAADAGYEYVKSVADLNRLLQESPPDGYFILVKGSRSNHLEEALALL